MKKINAIIAMLFALTVMIFLVSCGDTSKTSDTYPDHIYTDTSFDTEKDSNTDKDTNINMDSSSWLDSEGISDSDITSDSDIIITPSFTNVWFNSNGGNEIDGIDIFLNEDYTLPTPELFNHLFLGWYYNDTLVELSGTWNIDEENVELIAKWEKINENIYQIIYDFNGGNSGGKDFISYYTVSNSKIKINTPMRDGNFKFIGWQCGDSVSYSYSIEKNQAGDIHLKALWYEYEYTYQDSSGLQYLLKEDNTLSIVGYVGNASDIRIPSTYDNCTVTEIGEYAFCGFEDKIANLQSSGFVRCDIPDTVAKISVGAFFGCDDLKVQLYTVNSSLEEWVEAVVIEDKNDHVLDVINGKRPAIGWKKYVIPGA